MTGRPALSQRMRRNPRAVACGQVVAFLALGVGLALCGGTAGLGLVVLVHLYSGRR